MHDRNGTPLAKGDVVVIKARIIDTQAAEEYCNVNLEIGFEAEHGPHNVHTSLSSINTRQLLLVEKAAT